MLHNVMTVAIVSNIACSALKWLVAPAPLGASDNRTFNRPAWTALFRMNTWTCEAFVRNPFTLP